MCKEETYRSKPHDVVVQVICIPDKVKVKSTDDFAISLFGTLHVPDSLNLIATFAAMHLPAISTDAMCRMVLRAIVGIVHSASQIPM